MARASMAVLAFAPLLLAFTPGLANAQGTRWPNYSRGWRAAEEGAKWGAALGAVVGVLPA